MKISVITACYCCAPYLTDCIDSVHNQGYADYEHIIVDDNSIDGSYRMLKKFARRDDHLRIFKSDRHLHCGGAYSYAASQATGDIIAVLDSDDALVKNAMRNLVFLYKKYPDVQYMWTQYWLCDSGLRIARGRSGRRRGVSRHPGSISLLEAGVKGKHCFSHWRTFRRELLKKSEEQSKEIFRKGLKSAVDKYMGYTLEELGVGGFVNYPMYKYRQRRGGLSFTGRKNWEKMKRKFTKRRTKHDTKPFKITELSIKGLI